jgi:hypothetical protein
MNIPDFKNIKAGNGQAAGSAKKAVVKGGSALLVAISLLTSAAFNAPADILEEHPDTHPSNPPIVLDIDEFVNTDIDDEDDADEQKATKLGFFARFRQAVLSLPSSVRLLIVTPLWLLGTGLMTLVTFLWNSLFASPLGAFIASFAIGFAVLTGLFAVTAKTLFPDVPLRDILTKRNILILGVGAVILSGIDAAMPLFWEKYPAVSFLVKLVFGAGVISVLSLRVKALSQSIKAGLHLS